MDRPNENSSLQWLHLDDRRFVTQKQMAGQHLCGPTKPSQPMNLTKFISAHDEGAAGAAAQSSYSKSITTKNWTISAALDVVLGDANGNVENSSTRNTRFFFIDSWIDSRLEFAP